ncbi:MAG: molybdate ABC transporter substrate-binding protein [Rubrivivax sp.]
MPPSRHSVSDSRPTPPHPREGAAAAQRHKTQAIGQRLRLAVLLAACAVCGPSWAGEITVSAAASLREAFTALVPLFQAAHPGTTVRLNTAASGVLLQQIQRGAPVDVFASADTETMDRAQPLLQAGSRHDFATTALVVVVPIAPGAPALQSLADLTNPAVTRVAVGVPASVPAGRYARQALQQAGLWAAVEPKVVGVQNVRQALDYAARAEVDAAFVYATDAALKPDRVRVALQVPGVTVRYPIAVLAASADPAAAQRFVDYVRSKPAQGVLMRFGFTVP